MPSDDECILSRFRLSISPPTPLPEHIKQHNHSSMNQAMPTSRLRAPLQLRSSDHEFHVHVNARGFEKKWIVSCLLFQATPLTPLSAIITGRSVL